MCRLPYSRSPPRAQMAIFIASGSIALLADLIHNFGDASTAIPLGVAFLLRSARAERIAGLFVVATIFVSACVAGVEADLAADPSRRLRRTFSLWPPPGLIGFAGNWIAAGIRTRAGQPPRQPSPDRRRQPRPRRLIRQLGRGRHRGCRRARPTDSRPADRPRHHRGHPQDHLGLVADSAGGAHHH